MKSWEYINEKFKRQLGQGLLHFLDWSVLLKVIKSGFRYYMSVDTYKEGESVNRLITNRSKRKFVMFTLQRSFARDGSFRLLSWVIDVSIKVLEASLP